MVSRTVASLGAANVLRGHHAACGAVLVTEQASDLRCVLDAHEAQQRFRFLVGEVADDVGCVVGLHVADEACGACVVEVVDELGLQLVFHFEMASVARASSRCSNTAARCWGSSCSRMSATSAG